jgi:hypothetical protein
MFRYSYFRTIQQYAVSEEHPTRRESASRGLCQTTLKKVCRQSPVPCSGHTVWVKGSHAVIWRIWFLQEHVAPIPLSHWVMTMSVHVPRRLYVEHIGEEDSLGRSLLPVGSRPFRCW